MRGMHSLRAALLATALVGGMAAAVMMITTRPAPAQSVCARWDDMRKGFEQRYGEVPIGGGQVDATRILTVLASPDGETFTILIITNGGMACAMVSGMGWNPGTLPVKETRG